MSNSVAQALDLLKQGYVAHTPKYLNHHGKNARVFFLDSDNKPVQTPKRFKSHHLRKLEVAQLVSATYDDQGMHWAIRR